LVAAVGSESGPDDDDEDDDSGLSSGIVD